MTNFAGLAVALLIITAAAGYGDLLGRLLKAGLQAGATGLALRIAVGLVFLGWMMFWLLLAGSTSAIWFAGLLLPGILYATLQWRILVHDLGSDLQGIWPLLVVAMVLFAVDMLAASMPTVTPIILPCRCSFWRVVSCF